MMSKPIVVRTRSSIGCATNVTEKWSSMLTDAVATPDVSLVEIYFVVEGVIDLQ